jgi:hypothetical protein
MANDADRAGRRERRRKRKHERELGNKRRAYGRFEKRAFRAFPAGSGLGAG